MQTLDKAQVSNAKNVHTKQVLGQAYVAFEVVWSINCIEMKTRMCLLTILLNSTVLPQLKENHVILLTLLRYD